MDTLLPDRDTQPRCSPYTRELGIDPVGTAVNADQILVVDVPRPWPKPVGDHPTLEGAMDLVSTLHIRTRLFASVPRGDDTHVVRVRRAGAHVTRIDEARAPDLAAQLLRLGTSTAPGEPVGRPVLLVCTQGSHDVCCGSDGERFAVEVEAHMPHVEVLRISHTGGHRFAPTGMTLPDGRMWAHLDLELLDAVLERRGEAAAIAGRCRGWSGAERGFGQAAEREIFARVGWDLEDTVRRISVSEKSASAAQCIVEAGESAWRVQVEVAREVPTISCRAYGGLPAKTTPEYRVVDVVPLSPIPAG